MAMPAISNPPSLPGPPGPPTPPESGAPEADARYPFRTLLADLRRFVRPYRGRFAFTLLVLLAGELSGLYPGWALGKMVTLLSQVWHGGRAGNGSGDPASRFWLLLGLWGAAGLAQHLLREVGHYFGFQVAQGAGLDARIAALRHAFSLDLAWHERENTGSRLKRIANGEEGVHQLLRMSLAHLLPALVITTGAVAVLLTVDRLLSVALALFLLTYYPLSHWTTHRARRQAGVVHQREEEVEGLAFQALSNVVTVKALHFAGALNRILAAAVGRLMESIRQRILVYRIREGSINVYGTLFRLLAIAYIGHGILARRFEIGLLVLWNTYFDNIWRATSELSFFSNEAQIRAVAVGRMMSIFATPPVIEAPGKRPMPRDWQRITFSGVTFAYRRRPVLADLDLTIRRGERIGIVGPSGAGKSTLFLLLLKLRENYAGEIRIDDVPLRDIDRTDYLRSTAVVLQETEVFNMSLAVNIEIAAEEKLAQPAAERRQRLARALEIANLTDLVRSLPQGVDTPIGEKGVRLSGGERQRLGIARAVYKEPDILLLDEATASLDSHSETLIQEALEHLFDRVTAVVIAHRLSTVRKMDRILVLDEGRLVEQGTFEALLARRGPFYELWRKQNLAVDFLTVPQEAVP
jgi:ATP-binding cassette, subfamily B, heavy metal transporter